MTISSFSSYWNKQLAECLYKTALEFDRAITSVLEETNVASICPECQGKGQVLLLNTYVPCKTCKHVHPSPYENVRPTPTGRFEPNDRVVSLIRGIYDPSLDAVDLTLLNGHCDRAYRLLNEYSISLIEKAMTKGPVILQAIDASNACIYKQRAKMHKTTEEAERIVQLGSYSHHSASRDYSAHTHTIVLTNQRGHKQTLYCVLDRDYQEFKTRVNAGVPMSMVQVLDLLWPPPNLQKVTAWSGGTIPVKYPTTKMLMSYDLSHLNGSIGATDAGKLMTEIEHIMNRFGFFVDDKKVKFS